MKKLQELFENVKITFLTSASKISQCPPSEVAEYALLGRSNVGKSSFLNHIFSSKSLVKVSRQPGKTRLINFFSLNEDITFVDLPGYGYAKMSHADRDSMGDMIREYCEKRENLKGVIWLLDFRREDGTDLDRGAASWLAELGIPVFVILTKSDKLNQKEVAQNLKSIRETYKFPEQVPVLAYTTTREKSRDIFWNRFYEWMNANKFIEV